MPPDDFVTTLPVFARNYIKKFVGVSATFLINLVTKYLQGMVWQRFRRYHVVIMSLSSLSWVYMITIINDNIYLYLEL